MLDVTTKVEVPKRDELPFVARNSSFVLVTIALLVGTLWWPVRMGYVLDDTYITFRYSQHVAQGLGIVWNAGGAHTEGYTNFLYMLLLVPFSALGSNLLLVSQLIGVLAVCLSAIAIYRIILPVLASIQTGSLSLFARKVALVISVLFLLDPWTWMNAYSGLESSVFVMLLLFALWAFSAGRLNAAFVFATLTALVRPEGALLGVVLLFVALFQKQVEDRGATVRSFAAYFVAPLILYALWKLWYFGNLLPNSFYVKVVQSAAPSQTLLGRIFPGYGTIGRFYIRTLILVIPAILGIRAIWRIPVLRSALLWCVLLSTFYLFSHLLQAGYGRFTLSIEAILFCLAAPGAGSIARKLSCWRLGALRMSGATVLGILVIAVFVAATGFMRIPRGWLKSDRDTYLEVATMLRAIPQHDSITLAWADAGELPYYSELRHIDPVGLNTNEIAHAKYVQQVIDFIVEKKPDLIILPLIPRTNTQDTCQSIFEEGHGLIGSQYSLLAQSPEFRNYVPIALVPYLYELEFFVDTRSPHYSDIARAFQERIATDSNFQRPPKCIE